MLPTPNNWDKYIVPIITTVIGGIVLVVVLDKMGLTPPPENKNADTAKTVVVKESPDKVPSPTTNIPSPKNDKVAPKVEPKSDKVEKVTPTLHISEVAGEWEQQSTIPGLPKSRLHITRGGFIYWKRSDRTDRVRFTLRENTIVLESATDDRKSLTYTAERNSDILTLDLKGVTLVPTGLSRLGGRWKRIGDTDPALDAKPMPLDARLPGRWTLSTDNRQTLEITALGTFACRRNDKKDPIVSGQFEFGRNGTLEVVLNGRELYPLRLTITSAREIEFTTIGNGSGDERSLRGKWTRLP